MGETAGHRGGLAFPPLDRARWERAIDYGALPIGRN